MNHHPDPSAPAVVRVSPLAALRRAVAGVMIAGVGAGTFFAGGAIVDHAPFAHAEARVEASREELARVEDLAAVFRQVGRAVEPSVVSLIVNRPRPNAPVGRGGGGALPDLDAIPEPFREQFRRFFEPDENGNLPDRNLPDPPQLPPSPDLPDQLGRGSGVILDAQNGRGYVLTNNHVVEGAGRITVELSDGRRVREARVVGADPKSDLAVVEITADRLIPARWGDSDSLEKGDIIFAFGSPLGFVGSMTQGIVSALNRDRVGIIGNRYAYENFIQVDAPINPGNSGGPLVNLRGEVVGVNTAIASRTRVFSGIGFAIPSNQAKAVYDQLRSEGRVTRGYLGVEIADVANLPENVRRGVARGVQWPETGVFVSRVSRGDPADGALLPGDVVTALNGQPTPTSRALRDRVAASEPGSRVELTVLRDGRERAVTVTLGEQPESVPDAFLADGRGRGGGDDAAAGVDPLPAGLDLGDVPDRLRERLGVDDGGAAVRSVVPGSRAARAGVRPGEVIVRIDGEPVPAAAAARERLRGMDDDTAFTLHVVGPDGSRFVFVGDPEE